MKHLLTLCTLVLLSSCGFLDTAKVHHQMLTRLKDYHYPVPVKELQKKVVTALHGLHNGEAPLVITSGSPEEMERDKKIKEKLEEGYEYKGKLFVVDNGVNVGLGDIFSSSDEKSLTDKIKESVSKAKFHVVEDRETYFTIIFENKVLRGRRVDDKSSTLSVEKITRLKRGPLELDMEVMSFLTGGSLFNVTSTIQMVPTMRHTRRDQSTELSLFYLMDKETSKAWEDEFRAQL